MVPSSVFPQWVGSPGTTPAFLVFASYWQHFWCPASYLLGLCSILTTSLAFTRYMLPFRRPTQHTYSLKVPTWRLHTTHSHIYMCYVSISYLLPVYSDTITSVYYIPYLPYIPIIPYIPYLSYLLYIPHIPYICNIIATPTIHTIPPFMRYIPYLPYIPNIHTFQTCQTRQTIHTIHTQRTIPHPHHTTGGGGGQYHTPTTPQGAEGGTVLGP